MNKITAAITAVMAMFRLRFIKQSIGNNGRYQWRMDTSRTGISERRLLKLRKRNFLPCNSGSKDLIQRQHKSEEIDLI
jgi:hypothetical protein